MRFEFVEKHFSFIFCHENHEILRKKIHNTLEFRVFFVYFVVKFLNKVFSNKLFLFCVISMFFFSAAAIAFAQSPAASRSEGGITHYYLTLHEAFEETSGTSIKNPAEIVLLADITVNTPLIIEDGKHIRLVAEGDRIIKRGSDLLDYPVVWVKGENASLTLGLENSGMKYNLIVDGGFQKAFDESHVPIIANTPLVVVSGPDSKLIMYDNVTIQNNKNSGSPPSTSIYENGTGVFIRTAGDQTERLAEFIMRGGVIRGNVNNLQNAYPNGGGVTLMGFGLFTMEGGVIKDNTAMGVGGGVAAGGRASMRKTGGFIYGKNAPAGLRNTAIHGTYTPVVYGHALLIASRHRNDTVRENDNLSYMGNAASEGHFGENEKWAFNNRNPIRSIIVILIPIILVSGFLVFFFAYKAGKKKPAGSETVSLNDVDFTADEKKVLDFLLTDMSLKMIADRLDLTLAGVKYHCYKIYRKLNVKNRTELLVKYR